MEIIDSHTHVDNVEPWVDPPEKLVQLLDEANIQKAVIMTYCDTPIAKEDGLDYIIESLKKFPDRLIGYARLHPQAKEKAIALLEEMVLNHNFKGLKFHPESNKTRPYHEASLALIRKAGSLNIPTLFHCGDESLSLPLQIARAAEACRESKIILGHMGGYFHVDDALLVAEKYENIYLETSAMPYPDKILEAVRRIGAERVLFASDGPGCNPELEVKKVQWAGLSEKEYRLVMGENFAQILERVKKG
ncbi:amidohydrolase family protein [Paenibacillus agricola]|uniref:Amidohydrolase family protein n=1 Tax=Paenibacillus agricola TaxID=2716264 RepID=A0ABX0JDF3_9BACL|nr:TatD family hydrolase [Paenibacillus agricola]NHN31725.1 amidohydrolase family protein [Paenibacillus agricola]